MNFHDIKVEITKGEGLRTEFKKAKTELPKNFFETACAFLNTDGGTIFLGIADNGEILGVDPDSAKKLKADLANLSNNPQKISPPHILFPSEAVVDGKLIIVIDVPLSSQLHQSGGKTYMRSEDGDYCVRDIHQMAGVINRKLSLFTEQRGEPYVTMDDLRPELFDRARRLIRSQNSQHPWLSLTDEELLRIAGFYTIDRNTGKDCFNLAAVLMFGNDIAIQRVVPAYKFDCLLRRKNIDRYDDRLMIRTNLIDAYDQMMEFVQKHLNDPFYLEGDMRISLRDKIFREAISNIVSHREYTAPVPARLIIYSDRVYMDNPSVGHQFGRITPENLRPYSKNPVICKFMIQLGRFDELGSGVTNINKYLPLYANGAKPVFEDGSNSFELIVPLAKEVAETTPKTTPKTTGKTTGKAAMLLDLIKGDPNITVPQMADSIGLTSDGVQYHLKELQKKGVLKRVGGRKQGHWEVLDE
jgi:ATP-dependent DNA helicase RecG